MERKSTGPFMMARTTVSGCAWLYIVAAHVAINHGHVAAAWVVRPVVLARNTPNVLSRTTQGLSRQKQQSYEPVVPVEENMDRNQTIARANFNDNGAMTTRIFADFVTLLQNAQRNMIAELEALEEQNEAAFQGAAFSHDPWGFMVDNATTSATFSSRSGGLTRVLQGGTVIDKGACSLTVIENGTLTIERAAALHGRQQGRLAITGGDFYSAAALSVVLHTVSPHVPTFRSDVRVFLVQSAHNVYPPTAFFGGGADLTPSYLYVEDIVDFHSCYQALCAQHAPALTEVSNDYIANDRSNRRPDNDVFTYASMKRACDDYFYLPARDEHRGTGGIFFDDMRVTTGTLDFCAALAATWLPSWLPIVQRRQHLPVSQQQKAWQLLRRGRYLEFNLLYDRRVKFGLANVNPRVEGVMVSAPPLIAYEYCHQVVPNSDEDNIMQVLQEPRDWV